MWGKVDTGHNNAIDMTLGLPARALRRMGIKIVDESRVLTFHIGGTAHAPEINIAQCVQSCNSACLVLQLSLRARIQHES